MCVCVCVVVYNSFGLPELCNSIQQLYKTLPRTSSVSLFLFMSAALFLSLSETIAASFFFISLSSSSGSQDFYLLVPAYEAESSR